MHYGFQFGDYFGSEPHSYSWRAVSEGLSAANSATVTAIAAVIIIIETSCDFDGLPANLSIAAASSSSTSPKFQVEVVGGPSTDALVLVDSYGFYLEVVAALFIHSQLQDHLVKPSSAVDFATVVNLSREHKTFS